MARGTVRECWHCLLEKYTVRDNQELGKRHKSAGHVSMCHIDAPPCGYTMPRWVETHVLLTAVLPRARHVAQPLLALSCSVRVPLVVWSVCIMTERYDHTLVTKLRLNA